MYFFRNIIESTHFLVIWIFNWIIFTNNIRSNLLFFLYLFKKYLHIHYYIFNLWRYISI